MAKHLTTKEQIEQWTILEQTKYKDWKVKNLIRLFMILIMRK